MTTDHSLNNNPATTQSDYHSTDHSVSQPATQPLYLYLYLHKTLTHTVSVYKNITTRTLSESDKLAQPKLIWIYLVSADVFP